MCRVHFDIDDRLSLRGFRPEDRQYLVNGLIDRAGRRWLGRVPHPYWLDHANAFLAREEHLHVNDAVRDGSRSLLVGSEESILEEVAGFGASLLLMENSRAFELEADHLFADWIEAIGCDP